MSRWWLAVKVFVIFVTTSSVDPFCWCPSKFHGLQWMVQGLLQKGMEALSQAEVASALQIFFNLGDLRGVCPPHP